MPKAKPAAKPNNSRTFEQLLAPYPDAVQRLAKQTRAFIRRLVPKSIETVDGSGPYISYGYTSGYKGQVCTIIVSKGGVKLGVAGGASLPDPDKLLAGSGKVHRFIALKSADDLKQPGVEPLVRTAAQRAKG